MPELTVQDMPWLRRPMQAMVAALRCRRLAGAYLVHGQHGSGHCELAGAIQAILMCTQPADEFACGRCSSCRLLAAAAHPDAWIVEPHKEGHAIKVDQIRDLRERLEQTAQLGGYRCVVLAPAGGLNVASANSLLKLLEEPGKDVIFLLVSEHPERLLPTIRSRCQRVPVKMPSKDQVVSWLQSQWAETDTSQFIKAWRWSGRTPLAALSLLESEELSEIDDFTECLRTLKSSADTAEWARRCDQRGLDWVLNVLHRYVAMMITENKNTDQSGHIPWFWLSDQLAELKRLKGSGVNLNAQLLWEKLALQWQTIRDRPQLLKTSFIEV